MVPKDKYQEPTLMIYNMSTADVITASTSTPTVAGETFETVNEFNDWY